MEKISMFARLTKIDEVKRQVTGVLAAEEADLSNEVFDYELSKPHFQKWSSGISKATNGQSVGNLRAMHGSTVAGKFSEMIFNDAAKSIEVTADVVDDNEWKKCLKGCYTGFSIGGKYEKKWADPTNAALKRYIAVPTEGSLVDLPCIPSAQFTVVKADGLSEQRPFIGAAETNAVDQIWKCAVKGHEHAKKSEAESCTQNATESLRKGLVVADVRPEFATAIGVDLAKLATPAPAAPPAAPAAASVVNPALASFMAKHASRAPAPATMPGVTPQPSPEAELDPRIAKFTDNQMTTFEAELPLAKTAEELEALIVKVAAIAEPAPAPAPVVVPAPVVAVIKAVDFAKAVSAGTKALHKRLVKADMPATLTDLDKAASDAGLRKGLYTVCRLADMLEQLQWIFESYEIEQTLEGDDSQACAMLEQGRDILAGALAMMAKEETDELTQKDEDTDVMLMRASVDGLVKSLVTVYVAPPAWTDAMRKAAFAQVREAPVEGRDAMAKSLGFKLTKAGARNSAKDKEHLNAIHDHSVAMGAECDPAAAKSASGDLAKVTEAHKSLAKQIVAVAKVLSIPGESTDIVEPVTKMFEELTKYRALPAPAKVAVMQLDKSAGLVSGGSHLEADDAPVLGKNGEVDQEATAKKLIKRAQRAAHS